MSGKKITFAASFLLSLFVLLRLPAAAFSIPPDLKKTVTFIFLADQQGNVARNPQTHAPLANGTGFFVAVKSEKDPK
jgi:hypothetical protein